MSVAVTEHAFNWGKWAVNKSITEDHHFYALSDISANIGMK